jgi:hypothetical protein
MTSHIATHSSALEVVFLVLQAFQVAFLWLHDWIPLGRLNNIAAVQSQDSRQQLVPVTVASSAFFTLGLIFCLLYIGQRYPQWLTIYLWVTYAGLLSGQIRAWWVAYIFIPDPPRASRYQTMFANTHSFLPQRNGMVPNSLHVILHFTTVITLLVLFRLGA